MLWSQLAPGLRATLVFALLTGLIFPAIMTVIAQLVFPEQANGSLIVRGGQMVGSDLIAQSFNGSQYFHARPSAAGAGGYAGEASGGTNLGPTSRKLIVGDTDFLGVKQLAEKYRAENFLPANAEVPVDAVTRSASGLDPHITPTNALLQARRVAKARNVSVSVIQQIVGSHLEERQFGFLGQPRINVLRLNLALDEVLRR